MAAYRLEHVGIVVPPAKREATVNFYESVFGWQTVREMPRAGCIDTGPVRDCTHESLQSRSA